jgi:hypothetical protein
MCKVGLTMESLVDVFFYYFDFFLDDTMFLRATLTNIN